MIEPCEECKRFRGHPAIKPRQSCLAVSGQKPATDGQNTSRLTRKRVRSNMKAAFFRRKYWIGGPLFSSCRALCRSASPARLRF